MNHSASIHPSIRPSLSKPHLQPPSRSVSFCLLPVLPYSDSLSTHTAPFSLSFYLIPFHMHCCIAPAVLAAEYRASKWREGKARQGKKKKTELKGGKTNWWWPVRKRRAIKWAKTEAWWDGEVASLLQSDIAEWGRAETIDGFRRHRAIKRQRSIKSGVLGRTRVQRWFKLNFIVCVMMAFVVLSLCVCNHFNCATRLFALKQASLWWTCESFRQMNFTVSVFEQEKEKEMQLIKFVRLNIGKDRDWLQVSICSVCGAKGR